MNKDFTEDIENTQEENSSLQPEETPETAVEEAKESADGNEEAAEDIGINICPNCGEREIEEGEYYCKKCSRELMRTKIPVPAKILGAVAVICAVFAFIMTVLIAAPALQVIKGDLSADKKIWFGAYENYADVEEMQIEVSQIMNGTSLVSGFNNLCNRLGSTFTFDNFISTGARYRLKVYKCVYKMYGPIKANEYAARVFTSPNDSTFIKHNGFMKESQAVYDEYTSAIEKVRDIVAPLNEGEPTPAEIGAVIPKILDLKESGDVPAVWFYYMAYDISASSDYTVKQRLELIDGVDKAAKESKRDYSWLYYEDYIGQLVSAGRDDEAMYYIKELKKDDLSNEVPVIAEERILIRKKDFEAADKLVDEFCANNLTTEGKQSDDNYILMINLERSRRNYDGARALLDEAMEEYSLIPEFDRQYALIYLVEGDYESAFDSISDANEKAYYRSYYYGDISAYTPELDETSYLVASLCKEKGVIKDADKLEKLNQMMDSIEGVTAGEKTEDILSGKVTVEQVLTEGVCDLI